MHRKEIRTRACSYLAVILSLSLLAPIAVLPALADEPQLNFKIYNPDGGTTGNASSSGLNLIVPKLQSEEPKLDQSPADETLATPSTGTATAAPTGSESESTNTASSDSTTSSTTVATAGRKTLKGYVRVVPTGTKIPIIMDTAIDSDTSQEADEFSARTSEDLNIDGSNIVPAGSIIKGRIAKLNAPRQLNRGGSVALKFDTITTPDNRQIPIVANLVARGGVVHARRGMKDIAIDTGAVVLPTMAGMGIGLLAGSSSSSSTSTSSSGIGSAGGAMIGAGVGLAVGLAILLSKKGKKIDVRPGDELKIQLAEDLRMPMM